MRVVHIDQIDLLNRRLILDVVGDRLQLHVAVGVEAEMPEVAGVVGQAGIDGGIVQVQNAAVGIAFIVLGDSLAQRRADMAAIALCDVMHALVDRALQRDQAVLGARLVVDRDQFELLAIEAAMRVEIVDEVREVLGTGVTNIRERTRQRVDIGDLDGVLGMCCTGHAECGHGERDRAGHGGQCLFGRQRSLPWHSTSLRSGNLVGPSLAVPVVPLGADHR